MLKPISQTPKNQIYLSEDFIKKLAEISAGYIPSEVFNQLIDLIQSDISNHYFTHSSEANLLRIIQSAYDKYSFLTDCIKYPHYVEIITTIASNSNYLTDILVRNPEYFYWISNPSNLEPKLSNQSFVKTVDLSLSTYKTFTSKVNFFRSLKRKEVLRIGLGDVLGIADLEIITDELSILAKTISSKLFQLCLEEIKSKYQIQNFNTRYCLIGLGKLGGNELNYSSDIDLIIFYEEEKKIKNKTWSEILTEAVHLFIKSASSITSSGFIFRVDFRLRPDGRNSPLCRSLNEYLSYYESRGEDWERQMLIKADFVGGSEDLFDKFYTYLAAFVYPYSFSSSPTDQIKKLKKNIEKNLNGDENIKLLSGGIRDIEFSVQALQMLNAGRLKELRTGNTLSAIAQLKKNKLLADDEAEHLSSSYKLYRKIEHYLQLMNDKQTHTIPSEGEMLEKISCYLKFKNSNEFRNAVEQHRKGVIKIYHSIMGKEVKVKEKGDISEVNFENKKKAIQNFTFLREGKGLLGQKEFDEKTIFLFQNIEHQIISYLKKSVSPDQALQNFVRIIKSSSFPNIWYRELNDTKFLSSLLTLCEYSQKAVDLFAEDDELKEYFLDRSVFDLVEEYKLLRLSIKQIHFTLAVQFTLGIIEQKQASSILSIFYRQKITAIFQDSFEKKHRKVKYFTAALGSFGTSEMTFNSDVDFIFVVDDLQAFPDSEQSFKNILQLIRNNLSPVEVDYRLRPEGKSSKLVWDIKNYDSYIHKRLRIWELQAFTKISFVCGDINLFNTFLDSLKSRLSNEKVETIRNEMKGMRKKLYPSTIGGGINLLNLKKSPGGLIDNEFTIQFFILNSSKDFHNLVGKSIPDVIETFKKENKHLESETLSANYSIIKKLDLSNQVMFNATTSILPSDKKKLNMLAHLMKLKDAETLKHRVNEIMKSNKLILQKIVAKN